MVTITQPACNCRLPEKSQRRRGGQSLSQTAYPHVPCPSFAISVSPSTFDIRPLAFLHPSFPSVSSVVREPFEEDGCCPVFATQNPKKDSWGCYFRGFQPIHRGCEKILSVFARFCLPPLVLRKRGLTLGRGHARTDQPTLEFAHWNLELVWNLDLVTWNLSQRGRI